MWALKKDGRRTRYVAQPGSNKAYTNKITLARKYETREEAVADSCIENEKPIKLKLGWVKS